MLQAEPREVPPVAKSDSRTQKMWR
jgi:hypothetical protein